MSLANISTSDPAFVHAVQQVLEVLGTLAFAVSGIRHAAAKHLDWFGGYVCGFAVAVGGGSAPRRNAGNDTLDDLSHLRDLYLCSTGIRGLLRQASTLDRQRLVCLRHLGPGTLRDRWYPEDRSLRTPLLGRHHHG